MTMIQRMIRYCQHDLWVLNVSELTGVRKRIVKGLRLLFVAVTEFRESILSIRATSLVYTTLLSLVPFLAVMVTVLKAFGVHQQIQPVLSQALDPLGPKGTEITTNIIQFVDNLQVGVLGAVGVAGLFYTTYSLIEKIEDALNAIWRVESGRPFARKIADYLSVVLVGPVFVFTAVGITASAQNHWVAQWLMAIQPLGRMMGLLTNVLPFFFMCVVFSFIYKFVPNTPVHLWSAVVGGMTAGVFWQLAGLAFTTFVANSGRYSAIYSSFAVLILFLIWLYVGWLIVLAGAQVAYYHQHPSTYLLHLRRKQEAPLFREYLMLAVLRQITRRFLRGKPPVKAEQLASAQKVPVTIVESLIQDLLQAGMVLRTTSPPGVVLARPPGSIRIVEVLQVVQRRPQHGPQAFSVGTDAISGLLRRRDAAVEAALDRHTLMDLVPEAPPVVHEDPSNGVSLDGTGAPLPRSSQGTATPSPSTLD